MAEPRVSYRSNSLAPYRVTVPTASKPFAVPGDTPPALAAKTSEVGIIGSTYLSTSTVSGSYKTLRLVGYGNVDAMTSGLSVLTRVVPRFTGFSPASFGGLWTFNGAFGSPWFLLRSLSDGRLNLIAVGADFSTMINLLSVSTYSFTSGTAVDILMTWTGTNDVNGIKIYIDGTLLVQGTAAFSSDYSDANGQLFESILPCNAWGQGETSRYDLNEMCVWNEVVDPTALNLVGPARTDFVPCTASDALPTIVTGCDYPLEEEVKDGVVYDNGNLTGSFGRHTPQTNQYWAPLEVQTEIYAILNADADLTTLLGANKIFDFVPDKTAYPYVTVNALPFIPRDNATHDGLECEFQLNVWYQPGKTGTTSRGNKPVQLIQKRLDELLEQRSLCVNGWNTLQLRRTFIDILVESDNVTRHGIQRFKLFLGSKD